jgi:hypothetical protein
MDAMRRGWKKGDDMSTVQRRKKRYAPKASSVTILESSADRSITVGVIKYPLLFSTFPHVATFLPSLVNQQMVYQP